MAHSTCYPRGCGNIPAIGTPVGQTDSPADEPRRTPASRLEEGEDCAQRMANVDDSRQTGWYAYKVYYNKVQPLIAECRGLGLEFFAPVEAIRSLLFLRCDEATALRFADGRWRQVWLYRNADRRPAVIPEREMEVFRFVVTAGHEGLTVLGDDRPEYHEGDRVRVTGGPFKGAEGHIKRIKRDRRLVVTIRGVVAVATTYIHPSLLAKVTEEV